MTRRLLIIFLLFIITKQGIGWGFFAHKKINYHAVFLLPPELMVLYKSQIDFISEHSVDPDKRRYAVPNEGQRHYIDLDYYGQFPFKELPRKWNAAVSKFSEDTLFQYGTVPWWIQIMQTKLTEAFKEKNKMKILKLSADIGHYISDAHVPLHATLNHDGQLTDQKGIHAFWESRIPELLAEKEWNFFIGKAAYVKNPGNFMWKRILESSAASDTVLQVEKKLSQEFPTDQKYSFEKKGNSTSRQYTTEYTIAYNKLLNGMVERRMRQSIFAVASFWYTAWVNAGQPDVSKLSDKEFTAEEVKEFEKLIVTWQRSMVPDKEQQ